MSPRDGRPLPPDHQANDLVHWQTQLVTADVVAAARDLRSGKAAFVSPGVTTLSEGVLGFTKGLQVRGPGGHTMQVIQR